MEADKVLVNQSKIKNEENEPVNINNNNKLANENVMIKDNQIEEDFKNLNIENTIHKKNTSNSNNSELFDENNLEDNNQHKENNPSNDFDNAHLNISLEKEIEISDVVNDSGRFKESDEFVNFQTGNKCLESIVKPSNSFNFEHELKFKAKQTKGIDKYSSSNNFFTNKNSNIYNKISNMKQIEYLKKGKLVNNTTTSTVNLTSNNAVNSTNAPTQVPSSININFNNYNNINNNYNFISPTNYNPSEQINSGQKNINARFNLVNNPNVVSVGPKKNFNSKLMDIYNELSSSNVRSSKESNILSKNPHHNTRNSTQLYNYSSNSNSYQEQFDKFYLNLKSKKNDNMLSYPVNTYKGLHHIGSNNNLQGNLSNQYRYNQPSILNNKKLTVFNQEVPSYKTKFMNNPKFDKFEKIINNDFRCQENDSFNLKDEMVDLDEEIMNFKRKHIYKQPDMKKNNFNSDPIFSNNDLNDIDSQIQFDENDLKIAHEHSDNNDWNNFIPSGHLEYSPVKEKQENDA